MGVPYPALMLIPKLVLLFLGFLILRLIFSELSLNVLQACVSTSVLPLLASPFLAKRKERSPDAIVTSVAFEGVSKSFV